MEILSQNLKKSSVVEGLPSMCKAWGSTQAPVMECNSLEAVSSVNKACTQCRYQKASGWPLARGQVLF